MCFYYFLKHVFLLHPQCHCVYRFVSNEYCQLSMFVLYLGKTQAVLFV